MIELITTVETIEQAEQLSLLQVQIHYISVKSNLIASARFILHEKNSDNW